MHGASTRKSAGAEGGEAFGAKERRVAMMRKFGNTNFAAYDKDNPVYVNGAALARKLRVAFTDDDQYLGVTFEDGKIVYIDVTKEEFTDYLKEVDSIQCDKETGAKAVKAAVGHTKEEVEALLTGKNLPEETEARSFGNTSFAAYDADNPAYVNGTALAKKLRVAMENDIPYLGIKFQNGKTICIDVTKESFSDYLKDVDSVRCDKETGSKAVKAEIGRTKEEVETLLAGKNLPDTAEEPRKFENTNFAAYDSANPVYVNMADLARKLRIAFEKRAPYLAVKFQDGKIIYIDIGKEEFTDYLKEVDAVQCDKETGAKAVKVAVGYAKSELKKELEG